MKDKFNKLISYDKDSGVITWLSTGKVAGHVDASGYRRIKVDGKNYLAHRLAFMLVNSEFPPDKVDHINSEKDDNRWCNLRACTQKENTHNMKNNNSFVGVTRHKKTGKWSAYSGSHPDRKHLGSFFTHITACYAKHCYEIGVHNYVRNYKKCL